MTTQPSQQRLEQLLDAVVVDEDGARVGEVAQILLDNVSGRPTWVRVVAGALRPRPILVPLVGASLKAGALRVPHPWARLRAAPRPAAQEGLSPEEEETLAAYYGIALADDDDLVPAPAPPPPA